MILVLSFALLYCIVEKLLAVRLKAWQQWYSKNAIVHYRPYVSSGNTDTTGRAERTMVENATLHGHSITTKTRYSCLHLPLALLDGKSEVQRIKDVDCELHGEHTKKRSATH